MFQTTPQRDLNRPLSIVWNHRWEYDKAPERFFAALQLLQARGLDFRLHLLGQRFRQVPPVFDAMQARFATQALHWGPIEAHGDYLNTLRHSDVVVSSALHDFQGIAVLEATVCGCIPVVPDRLAYRELFPAHCRYASHPDDAPAEAVALADHLSAVTTQRAPNLSDLSWNTLRSRYQALLQQAICDH
ncbi:MAG: glycosyltransferase [Mariprofundaceae bacterium]|nr:glycosyltransferase [Mariprofundaceae bacterium]